MSYELFLKKQYLKNYISQKDKEYKNLKIETNNLRTQKTINIILKNNLINERDNLKKLIKSYLFNIELEKRVANKVYNNIKISNKAQNDFIKKENEQKIVEYRKDTEFLINEEKKKIEIFRRNINHEKIKNKDDYYQKLLDEDKKKKNDIIKKKMHKLSIESDKLNRRKINSKIKLERLEESINKEIKNKKTLLKNNSCNKFINIKNNLLKSYNNIKTIRF